MKDSNTINNNVRLSKDSNANLNINSRTFAVYEQYLKKNTKPLDQEQESSFKETYELGSSTVVNDSLNMAQTAAPVIEDKPSATASISSIKVLIFGIVCGLMISAVSIFVLNLTGILPALTERLTALTSGVPTVSTAATPPTVIAEPQAIASTNIATDITKDSEIEAPLVTQTVISETNQEPTTSNISVDNSVTNPAIKNGAAVNMQKAATEKTPVIDKTSQVPAAVPAKSNPQPAISYEDYREEAGHTFYAE